MIPKKTTPAGSELREALSVLRPHIVRAWGFSLIAAALMLMPSIYMLEVYDRVVNSRSMITLAMLTLLVVGAFLVMEILDWARTCVMHEAGNVLDRNLRNRIFDVSFDARLRNLPGGTPQTMQDLRTLREFLSSPPLLAMMELPMAVLFIGFIFAVNQWLGWAALAGGLVQGLIAWMNERYVRPPLMGANMAASAAQQYADGTLRNAQVIEAMGMQRNIHGYWMKRQSMVLELQAKASDLAGGFTAMTKVWQLVVSSALLGLGCVVLLDGNLNGGPAMMIVASILGGRFLAPLVQIVGQWQLVVTARTAWSRLEELLAAIPPQGPRMPLPEAKGRLTVEGLVAGPPNTGTQILRGVAFDLQPGEVLAVVGPSACGKTTLARLLIGLWPAMAGKVRLDGVDIYQWDKAEVGPQIGYLPQGVQLFEGTIAENISRFGRLDMPRVHAAAQAVGLHEMILELPQGYDSPIGADGGILSGGQRQRIGLARAIYGDPVFVVLDEPNASLDEQGDAALAETIRTMKARGTTFVVMTHRTSVLAVADKMLVMKDGQVQIYGPRDDVLSQLTQATQKSTPPRAAIPRPANA